MVDDLRKALEKIASQYDIFECESCADELEDFLVNNGRAGKRVCLFTGSTAKYLCNIWHEGRKENISINGYHWAVLVLIEGQETIFDNIEPRGVLKTQWLEQFDSPALDAGFRFEVTESVF